MRSRWKNEKRRGGGGGGWECDSVMHTGFIVAPPSLPTTNALLSAPGRSLAHNMESINPHRIPFSLQDTRPVCTPTPPPLLPPLSLFPSSSVLTRCLLMYILDHEKNLVSEKWVAFPTKTSPPTLKILFLRNTQTVAQLDSIKHQEKILDFCCTRDSESSLQRVTITSRSRTRDSAS